MDYSKIADFLIVAILNSLSVFRYYASKYKIILTISEWKRFFKRKK